MTESYERQKENAYVFLKLKYSDLQKMSSGMYTIHDFLETIFSGSKLKQELALKVFDELKKEPCTFRMLLQKTGAKKSTLFGVCLSLYRSGFISRKSKREPFVLSNSFAALVREYSYWWERWSGQR